MCNEFDISLSGSRVRQSGSSPRSVCVTPLGSRLTVHPSQPLTRRRPSAFITTVCSYSIQPSAGGLLQPCIYNERPRTETGVCRVSGGGVRGGVRGGCLAFGGTGTFCRFKRVYIVSNYSVFAAAGAGPRSRRGASEGECVVGVRCTQYDKAKAQRAQPSSVSVGTFRNVS